MPQGGKTKSFLDHSENRKFCGKNVGFLATGYNDQLSATAVEFCRFDESRPGEKETF